MSRKTDKFSQNGTSVKQGDGYSGKSAAAASEIAMQENNIIPERRESQGLTHVSKFLDQFRRELEAKGPK